MIERFSALILMTAITLRGIKKAIGMDGKSYLGKQCGADDVPAYSVPARREDLSGLPKAWIGVGTLDIFHDEDLAYAQRLKDCGVECEIDIVPGAFHGFDVFDPQVPIVQVFRITQNLLVKKYLVQ